MNPNRIMWTASAAILLIVVAASMQGCASQHIPQPVVTTQDVAIPVGEWVAPPKELARAPLAASDIPQVVAPGTPGVTSCLLPADETKLKAAIRGDHVLLGGWDAWTTLPQ